MNKAKVIANFLGVQSFNHIPLSLKKGLSILIAISMLSILLPSAFATTVSSEAHSGRKLYPTVLQQYGSLDAGRKAGNAEYIFHTTSKWTTMVADTDSGNFLFHISLPTLRGTYLNIPMCFTFNSFNAAENIGFGKGWINTYQACLSENTQNGTVTYITSSGAKLLFPYNTTTQSYDNPQGFKGLLSKNPENSYSLTFLGGNSMSFDSEGKLTQVNPTHGVGYSISYNQGVLDSVQDSFNNSTYYTFQWNTNGTLSSVTDGMNQSWNFSYDDSHSYLLSVTQPNGNKTCSFTYNSQNYLVTHTDFQSNSYQISYNQDTPAKIDTWTLPSSASTQFKYQSASSPYIKKTEVKDGENHTLYYYFGDTSGRLEKVSTSETSDLDAQTCVYDQKGWVSSVSDANGIQTQYVYDTVGHIIKKIQAPPTVGGTSYVIEREYLPVNNIMGHLVIQREKATPTLWNETLYEYTDTDAPHYISKQTNALGESTVYDYNANGQIVSTTKPTLTGTKTQYHDYNPTNGSLQTITKYDGNQISFSFNNNGLLQQYNVFEGTIQSGTPVINQTTIYNEMNEATSIVDSIRNVTTTKVYGSNGQLTSRTNETGCTFTNTYTQNNLFMTNKNTSYSPFDIYRNPSLLMANSTSSLTQISVPEYRPNPYQTTDSMNHTRTFSYYNDGNMHTITDYLGKTTSLTYNTQGLLSSRTQPDGNNLTVTYNNNGLKKTETSVAEGTITWNYNDIGRPTSIQDPAVGIIQYAYSVRGDILQDEKGTYNYDLIGRKTGISYFGGENDTWTYTPDGYLSSKDGISYTYTPEGKIQQWQQDTNIATFNYSPGYSSLGLPGSITGQGVVQNYSYQYNPKHWLYSVTNTSKQQGAFSYTYTDQHNIASISNPNNTQLVKTYSNKILDEVKIADGTGNNFFHTSDTTFNSTDQRTGYSSSTVAGQSSFQQSYSLSYYTTGSSIGKINLITNTTNNQQFSYSYNSINGKLSSIQDSINGTYSFQHLPNGKISTISYPGGIGQAVFDYNGVLQKLSQISLPENKSIQLSWNRKDQITGITAVNNGSILSYNIQYNKKGQITHLGKTQDGIQADYWEFSYGPFGLEKAVKYSGTLGSVLLSQTYTIDQSGRLLSMSYVDETLEGMNKNGEYYFHSDSFGNIILLTDETGNPVVSYKYSFTNGKLDEEWNPNQIENIFLQKGILGTPVVPLGMDPIKDDFIITQPWQKPILGLDPGIIYAILPDYVNIFDHALAGINSVTIKSNEENDGKGNPCPEGQKAVYTCIYTCYKSKKTGNDQGIPEGKEAAEEYFNSHKGELYLEEDRYEQYEPCHQYIAYMLNNDNLDRIVCILSSSSYVCIDD